MTQADSMVVDAAERVFKDLADPQTIIQAGQANWKTPLWQALEEMGLPQAWIPEALGGLGLSLSEGFAVVRASGRAALAVPLVDTLAASWIAGQAGLSLPSGAATVVIAGNHAQVHFDGHNKFSLRARNVPYASEVQTIVVVSHDHGGTRVDVVAASDCQMSNGRNLAGDASDGVCIEAVSGTWAKAPSLSVDQALYVLATCRSLQIAGALEEILDMSVAYAKERVAFEKPIAKFQAVQQNLARLGGEVAAAVAVAESAADALAQPNMPAAELLLEVASAKLRCGEAAETAAAISHQVLGAIGFTEEHILHRYTLRALAWRDEFGSESAWAKRLGEWVSQGSSIDLQRLLSAR